MSIQLKFSSPKELNNLKEAKPVEKKQWHYANEAESTLELDTETWFITCPQNQKTAKINEWMADEGSFSMKLKSDDVQGNYADVDYTFAIAMVGQLCEPHLISQYIGQLVEVYKTHPSPLPKEEKPENEGKQPEVPEQTPEQTQQ